MSVCVRARVGRPAAAASHAHCAVGRDCGGDVVAVDLRAEALRRAHGDGGGARDSEAQGQAGDGLAPERQAGQKDAPAAADAGRGREDGRDVKGHAQGTQLRVGGHVEGDVLAQHEGRGGRRRRRIPIRRSTAVLRAHGRRRSPDGVDRRAVPQRVDARAQDGHGRRRVEAGPAERHGRHGHDEPDGRAWGHEGAVHGALQRKERRQRSAAGGVAPVQRRPRHPAQRHARRARTSNVTSPAPRATASSAPKPPTSAWMSSSCRSSTKSASVRSSCDSCDGSVAATAWSADARRASSDACSLTTSTSVHTATARRASAALVDTRSRSDRDVCSSAPSVADLASCSYW